MEKQDDTGTEALPVDYQPVPMSVAYHGGPGEIHFCARMWFRGLSQTVTANEWAVMQAHPHFGQFDFQVKE